MEKELKTEEKQYCYKYPHAAITTDNVIFGFSDNELRVLLVKRGQPPYEGCWAFPGGFLRMEETLEQCARRELAEETGFKTELMEQFHAFSDVTRDPRERVVTIGFLALVKATPEIKGGDDAAEAQWYGLDEIPPLAFDHQYILETALDYLRQKIHLVPIGFELLNEKFTMPELQKLYESILGVKFDRRNFQRKMILTGVVESLNEKVTQRAQHRTPSLFRFNKEKYDLLKNNKSFRIEF